MISSKEKFIEYLIKYYIEDRKFYSSFDCINVRVKGNEGFNNNEHLVYSFSKCDNKEINNGNLIEIIFKTLYEYIFTPQSHYSDEPNLMSKNEVRDKVKFAFREVDLDFLQKNRNNYDKLKVRDKKLFEYELKQICGGMAEHLLFNLLIEKYNAIPVLHRISMKSSRNDEVKDVDGLHYNFSTNKFYTGESKVILPTSGTVTITDKLRESIEYGIKKLKSDYTTTLINQSVIFVNSKEITKLKLDLQRKYKQIQNEENEYINNGKLIILTILSKSAFKGLSPKDVVEDAVKSIKRETIKNYFSSVKITCETALDTIDVYYIYFEDLLDYMITFMEAVENYDGIINKISKI